MFTIPNFKHALAHLTFSGIQCINYYYYDERIYIMYIIFPFILLLLIICALLMFWRKKAIIRKLCCMPVKEKLCRLNELIRPFGFEYLLSQDIFTSLKDAWQRDFGYCWLYDKSADLFNMVFDCEPVYFDHKGCTWMIELWKGQYGINTGAEIGIYKADSLVSRNQRKSTLFHTVPDDDLPFFEFTLHDRSASLYRVAQRHWWLTGFRMGHYAAPDQLTLKIQITFPSFEMLHAFVRGMHECGYSSSDIEVCRQRVSFEFASPHTHQPRCTRRIRAAFAQWKNRMFLRIYRHVTKDLCFTMDKLLYLYEYMPFAFRHMMHIRHKKSKRKGRRKFRHVR